MQSFVRMTSLKDIGGRSDYISNPDRQEHIVTQSAPVDWKPYIDFEASCPKTAKRNNEGREVIMALPNKWDKLPEAELQNRVGALVKAIVGDRDHQWAVHWNKAHTNLHVHIIFSERQREKNPGVWDRDIYLTADGKVARKKADRAKGADGKDLPPVHRKGTPKPPFTAKDKKFTTKKWLHEIKQDLRDLMVSRWGVQIDALHVLHEYHEGNGSEAPVIRAKNEAIRTNKALLETYREKYPDFPEAEVLARMKAAAEKGTVVVLSKTNDKYVITEMKHDAWEQEQKHRAKHFMDLTDAAREYVRETAYLNDRRKPLNPAVQKAPADLQAAFDALKAAQSAMSSARWNEKHCFFWQRSKKKGYREQWAKAANAADAAFTRMVSLGINPMRDGYEQHGISVSTLYLENEVDRRVYDLQAIADRAETHARPEHIPEGSESRQKAAQERFEGLCRDIAPERKQAAREALEAFLDHEFEGEKSYYMKTAIETVSDRSDQLLHKAKKQPQQAEPEKPTKERSSHDRDGR